MTTSAPQFQSALTPAPTQAGPAADGVRVILRLEGFAVLAAALMLYAHAGFSWPVFALLFLAPDLSMLAYLAGPRVGAFGYNLMHTYTLAFVLVLSGFVGGAPLSTAAGLIWIAHIGFDRALGYGLKYATRFGDTHLSRIGRR
jgi:hypothetical protein